MLIRFCGDSHQMYQALLPLTKNVDHFIHVGDVGLNYSYLRKNLPPDSGIKCLAGNHDCYQQDSPEYFKKQPFFLGDFGIHQIPNVSPIFYCRGAWSIDQAMRKRRQNYPYNNTGDISWWEDEQLNPSQLEEAVALYKETKPEIVVTHECPLKIVQYVTNPVFAMAFAMDFGHASGVIETRTNVVLQEMFSYHKPKYWIFGHYHTRWERNVEGTNFICLNMLASGSPGEKAAYIDFDENFERMNND